MVDSVGEPPRLELAAQEDPRTNYAAAGREKRDAKRHRYQKIPPVQERIGLGGIVVPFTVRCTV